MTFLTNQRDRIKQHEPRQVRLDVRNEGPAAELCKGMMAPIGCDDVVCSLGATIESNDCVRSSLPREKIDHAPFSRISKAEIDDDDRFHVRTPERQPHHADTSTHCGCRFYRPIPRRPLI